MRLRSSRPGNPEELDLTRARHPRELQPDEINEAALAALERSEAILANIGDGIFSTDTAGDIVLWNQAAERVIGCSVSRAVGRSCSDVLGLELRDRELDCRKGCALIELLRDKPPGTSVELHRRRRDGRDQPILMNVTPIKDAGGNVTEFVHSMRDITALKQADEAKTMFLATASHELKTPLTVILGFTQALLSDWLDEKQRVEALESIDRRAQELSRIVDRLLLTGRIEAGRITLDVVPVPLEENIKERVRSLALVTGRAIRYSVRDVGVAVMADEQALTTIIDHLLDNAVKYSPGGGDILIDVTTVPSNVEIEVYDEGIGMSVEESAHCFDRFWQAESSDVRRFGGTGVGLYIVRSLVEAMGGRISVRSSLGNGTTFTVRLQRASAVPVGSAAVSASRKEDPWHTSSS